MTTPIVPAARTEAITYAIRDVLLVAEQLKRQGRSLVALNIGDPCQFDFETPRHVRDAMAGALREGKTWYCASSGVETALHAIRTEAVGQKGFKAVGEIYITYGASEAIEIAMTALLNPGDNILLPSPGYPLYSAVTAKLVTEGRPYFLDEDNGWQPDLADVEARIDDRTRGLVLINPNNPTGSVCERQTLLDLIDICRHKNLVLFADEVYDRLILEGEHVPLASLADDVAMVSFNSLSKNYLGPGLRVGWGIVSGPDELVGGYTDAILKITRSRLCSNHTGHYAIVAALQGGDTHIRETVARLRARRDLTVERLNAIDGVSCVPPRGAFYAFPRLHTERADADVIRETLLETGIILVHGSGFGQRPGTRHFRLVFLPDEETLRAVFDELAQVLPGLL
jgi:alanine-synthesizing transaminase